MLSQFHLQYFLPSQEIYELQQSMQVLLSKNFLKSNVFIDVIEQIFHIQIFIKFNNEVHWRSNQSF